MTQRYDLTLVGHGLVAMAMALHLQSSPYRILWLRPNTPEPSRVDRLYALQPRSQRLLESLGCWDALRQHTRPYHHMTLHHVSPPARLSLDASDVPTDHLGYFLRESTLHDILWTQCQSLPYDTAPPPEQAQPHTKGWHLTTQDAEYSSDLVLLACGAHGPTLERFGLSPECTPYHQHAWVGWIETQQPLTHPQQWFHGEHTLGLLPDQGKRSAFVWSLPLERAQALHQAPPEEAYRALQVASQGTLGSGALINPTPSSIQMAPTQMAPIQMEPTQLFPLRQQQLRDPWPHRLIPLGDTAHAVHPMAGLGLNLGFWDVQAAYDALHNPELACWRALDFHDPVVQHYQATHQLNQRFVTQGIHTLQRLFHHPKLGTLRAFGLRALAHSPPIKRLLIQWATGDDPIPSWGHALFARLSTAKRASS